MKFLLLSLSLFASGTVYASPPTPVEAATQLCYTRHVGRPYARSVNAEFDFVACIQRGVAAYPSGELAVAKSTCFSFANDPVSLQATVNCMRLIGSLGIPNTSSFDLALSTCSKLQNDVTSLLRDALESEAEGYAKTVTFRCMKNLF